MRRFLVGLASALLLLPSLSARNDPASEIPDSPKGFDRQYTQFLKVFERSGGAQATPQEIEAFAIPQRWFVDEFGADNAPDVAKRYRDEFDYFRFSTQLKLQKALSCGPLSQLMTHKYRVTKIDIKVGDVTPAHPIPPSQSFIFSTMGHCSWVDTFIYIDGAFRFYGKGASTFLNPVKVHRADPCGPNDGHQLAGRLIHRVEPEYPEEAKQKHAKGFVKMILTVAPDGTVKEVKILEGNPLLVDAATQAALQWRYNPFMNCGKPVEMQASEHVKFPPPPSPPDLPSAAPSKPASAPEDPLVLALNDDSPYSGVVFDASGRASASDQPPQFRVYIDPNSVSWNSLESGDRETNLIVAVAGVSVAGIVLGHEAREFVKFVPVQTRAEQSAAATKSVILGITFSLPRDAARVRFVIEDSATGRFGSFDLPVSQIINVATTDFPPK